MPVEHIIAKQQAAWKTWVTPDKAIPVDSWSLDPGIERVDRRVTGQSRSLKYRWLGKKLVTGSFALPAWYEYMGMIIKNASLHDVVSTVQGATAAYQHGFLPKHDTMPFGLSVQAKRDADDADNMLGVLLNKLQFGCQAGEPLLLSGDYIAYDEAPTGGTWDYDGATAAPAVIASPAYFADTILPFRFQHGSLLLGATLTFDDAHNIYTKVGGTALTIEMVEVAIENNFDPRVFLGNRVAGNTIGQDFAVSGRFDLDQSTVLTTLRDAYRSGTPSTLWLEFDSGVEAATGYNYAMTVVVPNVDFGAGALPDLQGAQDRRMQSVEFTGLLDSNDVDVCVFLTDLQTSY